ncbi:MAG: prepilin peptidase [Acidobacteria bacterium]|nr:prepilin peptidase [Acidobacteriota bacterium]
MTNPFALTNAAIIGLAVGSFLNVCIYRIPKRESLLFPGSHCGSCGKPLRWFDNIPVASYLALRGRCGQCGAAISIRYPVVEVTTAVLTVLVVALTPFGPLLASRLILTWILIVLFAVDLELQILPNAITLPGIVVGLACSVLAPPGLRDALVGAAVGAGVLYGIAAAYYLVRREEGLGMGDVKMLAMIGAFLGWRAVLLTLVMSSFSGALVGVALMASKRGGLQYALPFGTFLAAGAFIAMLVGEPILAWYLGYFEGL